MEANRVLEANVGVDEPFDAGTLDLSVAVTRAEQAVADAERAVLACVERL